VIVSVYNEVSTGTLYGINSPLIEAPYLLGGGADAGDETVLMNSFGCAGGPDVVVVVVVVVVVEVAVAGVPPDDDEVAGGGIGNDVIESSRGNGGIGGNNGREFVEND
jgi:hypothetical protein